jgi:hypothetical protein
MTLMGNMPDVTGHVMPVCSWHRGLFLENHFRGQKHHYKSSNWSVTRVHQSMEAFLLEVDCFMAEMMKEVFYFWGYAHVCQEFHAEASSRGWTVSWANHAAY